MSNMVLLLLWAVTFDAIFPEYEPSGAIIAALVAAASIATVVDLYNLARKS